MGESDDAVWYILANHHCAYKAKTSTLTFCRNKYNVSGLCNRSSCPLANSLYATVLEHDGVAYLYKKAAERAHMPKHTWERIRLKHNYQAALQQIDDHLKYWPQFLVHKNKQRLTKIKQYLIRMRKLAKKSQQQIITTPRKQEKREQRREEKAEVAARVEKSIEGELLRRLQDGTYNDIYNFPSRQYEQALDRTNARPDIETINDDELELEEEGNEEPEVEYVEDFGEDDDDEHEADDMEDTGAELDLQKKHKQQQETNSKNVRRRSDDDDTGREKRKRRQRVELEYEETEPRQQEKTKAVAK